MTELKPPLPFPASSDPAESGAERLEPEKGSSPPNSAGLEARREREAAALRENLRRRKSAARRVD